MENNHHNDQAQAPSHHTVPSAPPTQPHEEQKHSRHSCQNDRKGVRPFRFVVSALVICVGLAMLSNTMGWGWFSDIAWWKLWPVVTFSSASPCLAEGAR